MAKSTRSKIKRAYRAKKRETGVYAVVEAARLQRLNTKLSRVVASGKEDNVPLEGSGKDDDIMAESMQPDAEQRPRISTHGSRNSRREEWRKSKGIPPRSRKDFRQGSIARGHSRKRG
ncbi:hypothetical protein M378DRAFT_72083 [Amanita muscaria Koide BX008]|uniref:DUF2423 domain-containing protein n=1 Tax=Amanita muscaria (strain Koide BX008) TaxID=946122 RepID=A0A0C2XH91_AMAMK|nr:hypothetical protein M378DRAFT_72083 [Amanita muscaria Koide BX008]